MLVEQITATVMLVQLLLLGGYRLGMVTADMVYSVGLLQTLIMMLLHPWEQYLTQVL